eukprot:TRINITY_DN6786_c0_g1_i1.p1 TRINITY_DN6786_c0_g1~~TRINITY_DN6786_c0_g1_i1.p1  ORF type:complete len:225 (+),score=23.54 TRINITY_DN6786_c0_g1_i1:3-677(+)
MSTSSANRRCGHNQCKLDSKDSCCSCGDVRPITWTYTVYIDGRGNCTTSNRSEYYCPGCKTKKEGEKRVPSLSFLSDPEVVPLLPSFYLSVLKLRREIDEIGRLDTALMNKIEETFEGQEENALLEHATLEITSKYGIIHDLKPFQWMHPSRKMSETWEIGGIKCYIGVFTLRDVRPVIDVIYLINEGLFIQPVFDEAKRVVLWWRVLQLQVRERWILRDLRCL